MDCAKCGRRFFLHSPVNALWCNQDHLFVCARCAPSQGRHHPRKCPFCAGAVANSLPVAFALGAVGLVIGSLFTPIFYAQATYTQGLADTPQVDISQLTAGKTVMVYGTIESNATPTLWANWVQTGRSGYWSWAGTDFWLVQGSTEVWVDVSGLDGNVFGAATPGNSFEYYDPGNWIAVIGTVSGTNGSMTLHAQDASTSPSGFADEFSAYAWIGTAVLAVLGAAGVVYGYWRGLQRLRAHEARTRQAGMYDFRLPSGGPDPPGPPE
jgi:hypothetical protein